MKWGVALNVRDGLTNTLQKAEVADQGGIDQIWVTDFPAVRYAPAVAAAIAERTKSCRIGVGLVSPLLYSTTHIEQFMSTLTDSYGERFDLLLGPGDKHALAGIGVSSLSKSMVDKTSEAIEKIRHNLSEMGHSCSTFLGAQGPLMIRASLKAHGVLLNYSDIQMAEWALNQIKSDMPRGFHVGVFPPSYIGECQDIEANQAVSYSAAMVAIGLSHTVSDSFGLREHIGRARVLMKERGQIDADVMAALGKETLQRFAFCGTSERLNEYIKELEKIGINSIVFGPPQGIRKKGVEILVRAKSTRS